MDSLQDAVFDCRNNTTDDDELIDALTKCARQHGSRLFQAVFHVFASLDVSQHLADKYWHGLLVHRQTMNQKLGRKIDFLPCLYDYLAASPHSLTKPRLIEEKAYARVIMETTHDSLTSMHNRHYFDEALEQAVSTAKRYGNDVSLLFLDIDNFKDINDTCGHQYGDTILQQVAGIIQSQKRESDIAARYGGEEFVLLMPHTESIRAFILAERIRLHIEKNLVGIEDRPMEVTISGGLASFPQNSDNSSQLVQRADDALYLAKGAGKNIICLYKEEKRRYLRVKYQEPVKIKELGFETSPIFSGTSKDICIGGILFENDVALPIGSRIQVSLPIQKGKPLLLIGTVVRVEAYAQNLFDIGMSISFKEMEKIASSEIANFLQNSLS